MTNESPAPVEIPGDTECAACGAKCPAGCYRAVAGCFTGNAFVGAPLCIDCSEVRGAVAVAKDITSRGGWPRKQAEVETWHGFAKGELVRHVHFSGDYVGTIDGHNEAAHAHPVCDCMLVKRADGTVFHAKHGNLERLAVPRPSKPASSQPIDVFHQTVKCDDCGSVLNALEACKRTRVVQLGHGEVRKEYVPGTFCASCPGKPAVSERPKLDPYAEYRGEMRTSEHWLARQDQIHQTKQAQALAALSRPLRTGPLKDRDKYGQKVSLLGWETDSEEP